MITVEDMDNEPDEYSGPSKSQLKREMTALQDLGAELVALSKDRLAKIDMPERLRDALLDAQRFTKHEAKRRQMQYIGKIMRDIDAAPLRAAMAEIKGKSEAANIRQHQLERLRTRLMEDEAVFSEVARDYPHADMQHLRQLRRNALKEAQQAKPPRAYRELFRELRELEGGLETGDAGDESP
jgi:ribosome-associated protein